MGTARPQLPEDMPDKMPKNIPVKINFNIVNRIL